MLSQLQIYLAFGSARNLRVRPLSSQLLKDLHHVETEYRRVHGAHIKYNPAISSLQQHLRQLSLPIQQTHRLHPGVALLAVVNLSNIVLLFRF